MKFRQAERIARAILGSEEELRGDFLDVVEKVARAASTGAHQSVARALRGHVNQPERVARRILLGEVPQQKQEPELTGLEELDSSARKAVATAIRHATAGSVKNQGERFARLAKRLEAHLATISDDQLLTIIILTFRTTRGHCPEEFQLKTIVEELARNLGKKALPYAQAARARCPDLQEVIERLSGG